jgi:hypothetical protein
MADINTQELFDLKRQKFGGGGSSDKFQLVFLSGVKYVLNKIRSRSPSVSATTPTDLATDITLDEDVWYAPVSSGLDFFINGHGTWTLDTKADLQAIFDVDMDDSLSQHQRDSDSVEGRLGDFA